MQRYKCLEDDIEELETKVSEREANLEATNDVLLAGKTPSLTWI